MQILKMAFRALLKNKTYSLIHLLGLSLGLACFAFIAMWVTAEIQVGHFNKNADGIFRLNTDISNKDESYQQAVSGYNIGPSLSEEIPEIEALARIDKLDALVQAGTQVFEEDNILLTEPSFFQTFDFQVLAGDPKTALTEPYSVMITPSIAKKYFGTEDPIGKSLHIYHLDPGGKGMPYKVSGLIQEATHKAHFNYTMLLSLATYEQVNGENLNTTEAWVGKNFYTYLRLKPGHQLEQVEEKIHTFNEYFVQSKIAPLGLNLRFLLQDLPSIYLDTPIRSEIGPKGNKDNIYLFSFIALFVLLIAGINYINLSTAQSLGRAQMVGVKKALGANRLHLVKQYLLESFMLLGFALVLAIVLVELWMPFFEQLTDKSLGLFTQPYLLIFLILSTILLGLFMGTYPALLMASFKTSKVIKKRLSLGPKAGYLRRALVLIQFTISIGVIAGLLIVKKQMQYVENHHLGFNEEAILTLRVNGNQEVINNFTAFKSALLEDPKIKGLAVSNTMIGGGVDDTNILTRTSDGSNLQSNIFSLNIDPNFLDVYEIPILAGRNFSNTPSLDTNRYLINVTAVKKFGWSNPDEVINQFLSVDDQEGIIIGVVEDFHFDGLYQSIAPLSIGNIGSAFSQISVRLEANAISAGTELVRQKWQAFFPGALLQMSFLDERLQRQYKAEQRFGNVFAAFSFFALFIACLGLFGLVSYASERRFKELGVRKVLGASPFHIIKLLTMDFIPLVLGAHLLASPIIWIIMKRWLQGFAYHIELNAWIFLLAGFATLIVAMITIGSQSYRAASMDPVSAIRNE